jgi:inorganic pyrophosphatase
MAKSKSASDPTKLQPFNKKDHDIVNSVIETPPGSRNKFRFDEEIGTYALAGVLPQGMVFPHAFGFVPGTRAADGDPEDVLVVMDLPVFTGCVVPTRLIGVIEGRTRRKTGKPSATTASLLLRHIAGITPT